MSYVSFTNTDTIIVSAPAVVTWNLPLVGNPGTARVSLPRDSAALDSMYINPDGTSWLRVSGDADIGEWLGYITELDEGPDDTVVHAVEWWGLLSRLPVPVNRAFVHVTPAVIVSRAISASPWQVLTAAEGGPDIPRWTFSGESIWDHVQRMMALGNQELIVEADQTFRWGTPTLTRYEPVLVAPHDLEEARQGTRAHDMVGKVTVISDTGWYTATDVQRGWPAHAVVKESLTPAGMAARAENELLRRREPARTITGRLARAHRALGFGDVFSVLMPYAGLGEGRLRSCRIVSRSYDDARDTVDVSLQILTDTPLVGASVGSGAAALSRSSSRTVLKLKQIEREALRGRRYLAETST